MLRRTRSGQSVSTRPDDVDVIDVGESRRHRVDQMDAALPALGRERARLDRMMDRRDELAFLAPAIVVSPEGVPQFVEHREHHRTRASSSFVAGSDDTWLAFVPAEKRGERGDLIGRGSRLAKWQQLEANRDAALGRPPGAIGRQAIARRASVEERADLGRVRRRLPRWRGVPAARHRARWHRDGRLSRASTSKRASGDRSSDTAASRVPPVRAKTST